MGIGQRPLTPALSRGGERERTRRLGSPTSSPTLKGGEGEDRAMARERWGRTGGAGLPARGRRTTVGALLDSEPAGAASTPRREQVP